MKNALERIKRRKIVCFSEIMNETPLWYFTHKSLFSIINKNTLPGIEGGFIVIDYKQYNNVSSGHDLDSVPKGEISMSTFITAEIGINHNGDVELAKKLIDTAVLAGCDAVKFRKRTIEESYTKEFLDELEDSPWGHTRRAKVEGLEFGKEQFDVIDAYCKQKSIAWYASSYDIPSQLFLRQYDHKYNKIASAMLTNEPLLEMVAEEGCYTFIATGMSTFEEIDHAVEIFKKHECPFELMHCISTYPMVSLDANLRMIYTLRDRYQCKVGYSGHEIGTLVSTCAVAMGATSVERHITLNKTLYGAEQKASVDPVELWKLVKDIRETEQIMGTGEKIFSESELELRKKCRR